MNFKKNFRCIMGLTHIFILKFMQRELDSILKDYVGRESPLYFAERLSEHYKRPNREGPLIYLKREDPNHTGAHKINNAVAQVPLAKRLGKERNIAETGLVSMVLPQPLYVRGLACNVLSTWVLKISKGNHSMS